MAVSCAACQALGNLPSGAQEPQREGGGGGVRGKRVFHAQCVVNMFCQTSQEKCSFANSDKTFADIADLLVNVG